MRLLLALLLSACSIDAALPDLKKAEDRFLTNPDYPCGDGGIDCSNGTCCPDPLLCSLAKNPDGSWKLDESKTSIPVCVSASGEEKQQGTKCGPPACAEMTTIGVAL